MSAALRLVTGVPLAPGEAKLAARRWRFVREHDAQVCRIDAETWQAHLWRGRREYTINGEDLEAVLDMAEVLAEAEAPGG